METERWSQVEGLFLRCEGLTKDAQRQLLEGACGDQPDLRQQVEGMLAGDRLGTDWMGRMIRQALVQEPEARPRRIGRYRLLGELGRGGLSTVHLAERADDQYRQRVALKLVRRGLESDETLRRMRRERQILADLEHPNIARLLDGDATADGVPYFVMEHIEGQPIAAYAEQHRLSLDSRLRLVEQVCAAVHHAHQRLVIHRDIKPSNILVTAEGVPKLLDFGIAKLFDPGAEASATVTGQGWMTPEYASPEQVRGEALTTATDIYSLGVLLYQLLTGISPQQVQGRKLRELEEAICEMEPPRPSLAVRQLERESLAGLEHSTRKLAERLSGDLDNIILKAMRKQPADRYSSAERLAEDLRRYRLSLPVSARPATWGYRVGLFVRRQRKVVIGGLLAAAALLAALIAVGWQARAAHRQRHEAEATLDLLFRIFDVDGLKEKIDMHQLVERGIEAAEEMDTRRPATQAELFDFFGGLYIVLGTYDDAGHAFERSVEVGRQLFAAGDLRLADALNSLGEVRFWQRDLGAAQQAFEEALEIRRQALGDLHLDTDEIVINLGTLARHAGDLERAKSLLTNAIERHPQALAEGHPDLLSALESLGLVYSLQDDFDRAEQQVRRSLELRLATRGSDHPEVAITHGQLAAILHHQGELEAAERHFTETLRILRLAYGDHHVRLVSVLINLAALRQEQGRIEEQEKVLREALEVAEENYSETHPRRIDAVLLLARLLAETDRCGEARPLLAQALGTLRETEEEDSPQLSWSESLLASCTALPLPSG